MLKEVRNLKGELVPDIDPDARWYHLSASTWMLLGGLFIFNIGCFVNPGIIDTIFRSLDVRLWPWWYFLALGLVLIFSIKWYITYYNWEFYDGNEADAAIRFNRMSVFITAVMAVLVILNCVNLLQFFYYPLSRWFGFGDFSWLALLSFTVLMLVIATTFYFIKEWVVTFWEN
ncbi:MAG: hypothetical protein ACRC2T_00580 [Thermoguttaceae bacterium]